MAKRKQKKRWIKNLPISGSNLLVILIGFIGLLTLGLSLYFNSSMNYTLSKVISVAGTVITAASGLGFIRSIKDATDHDHSLVGRIVAIAISAATFAAWAIVYMIGLSIYWY